MFLDPFLVVSVHERMTGCVFLAGQDIAILVRVGQVVANLSDVFLPLIPCETLSERGKFFVPALRKGRILQDQVFFAAFCPAGTEVVFVVFLSFEPGASGVVLHDAGNAS